MDSSPRAGRSEASYPDATRIVRDRGGRRRPEGFWRALGQRWIENDVLNRAAGVAYFAFLSLPPLILVLFAITGMIGGDELAEWLTLQLSALLPEESGALIDQFVDSVVHTSAPGALSIGLLLMLWAASNVFMALAVALNVTYDVADERSWVRQRALSLVVMILFVVLFLAGSFALIAGPQIAAALDQFGVISRIWPILQWPLPILVVTAAFWIVYYFLPARDQSRNWRILAGAAFATALWVIATIGFRFYISNFGEYDVTYGFMGGIIVLLLWLYVTSLVVLTGGVFAAELEARGRR